MTATGMEERKAEIKARAKKVYDISFSYHLTHAVFGGDKLLITDTMDANKQRITQLKNALLTAAREKNTVLVDELMAKIGMLERTLKSRKHHILIDYVPMKDIDGGRVIKVDDKLIISLPETLCEDIMIDGKLQREPVEKIRKKMAHELGHIVLHTDQLPEHDFSGSYSTNLKNLDWEAEEFATELLRLYKENDHRVD